MNSTVVPATRRVREVLHAGRQSLRQTETPALDAELLLVHVLGQPRVWVLAHDDYRLSEEQLACYRQLIDRRRQGVPVAYLRSAVDWFDMTFSVTPDVLIPRPETELLLENAIEFARQVGCRSAADIGTGSGALAVGLARHVPGLRVVATDISAAALHVAAANAARQGVAGRIALKQGHLLEAVGAEPEMIVANLPYLSDVAMQRLPRDVRAEPLLALRGGAGGFELYRELLAQAARRDWTAPVVLEIDPRQADELRMEAEATFPGAAVEVLPDYSGLPRIGILRPQSSR